MGVHPLLVEYHLDLALLPANGLDPRDAGNRLQLRRQPGFDPVAHVARAANAGREARLEHRRLARVPLADAGRLHVIGQLRPRDFKQARGILQGVVEVDAVVEHQIDVGPALFGLGTEQHQIFGLRQLALQHPHELFFDDFGRDAGVIDADPHQRIDHVGQKIHRQPPGGEQPQHQNHGSDRQRAQRPADGQVREAARVARAARNLARRRHALTSSSRTMRTASPAVRSAGLLVTTASPAARPPVISRQLPRLTPTSTSRCCSWFLSLTTIT